MERLEDLAAQARLGGDEGEDVDHDVCSWCFGWGLALLGRSATILPEDAKGANP